METIQSTWEEGVRQCDAWVVTAVQGTMLGLALLTAFFGYKLFRFYVAICGFVLGAALVVPAVADQRTVLSAIVIFTCAVVAGVTAFRFWRIGVFVGGGATGLGLALVANALQAPAWPVAAGAFLVAGLFAVQYERFVLITSTALSGSLYSIFLGASLFGDLYSVDFVRDRTTDPTLTDDAWTVIGAWAGLFVLAALVQWHATRHTPRYVRLSALRA